MTSPSTTAAPSTSTIAPLDTSPTTPPPATTAPTDQDEAAARDAYQAAFKSWTECLRALPGCDLNTLSVNRIGPYLDAAVAQAGRWNEVGQTAENVDSRAATVDTVQIDGDGTATLVVCEIDASVRRDLSGAVVDDEFQSARIVIFMDLVDGQWRIVGSEDQEVGSGEDGNVCAG